MIVNFDAFRVLQTVIRLTILKFGYSRKVSMVKGVRNCKTVISMDSVVIAYGRILQTQYIQQK